ncbi:hypothetical protein GCK72_019865 [Caenorhabditis remanei]|uniref:C-type lectin domain-containing protein n=1 Tax=Caenorhabditis remanei TaxID=31234 RepID=A0A6A5GFX5_CAERE|nr:hypothetical protein GCK72_019865 [Caenorhabditis remanei]KAF1753309.1 hypothetical protein GCK72_019865 [Caenorhabditis remanei]
MESCRNLTFGSLVTIDNAIDNRALINLATAQNTTRPIWIGLECYGFPCYWLDQGGTNYSNFASGNPQPDVGGDVYMLTSGRSIGK